MLVQLGLLKFTRIECSAVEYLGPYEEVSPQAHTLGQMAPGGKSGAPGGSMIHKGEVWCTRGGV